MGLLGAVCDPSAKVLESVPKLYPGAFATKSLAELLKSKEIDAVAIASPAAQHAATAKAALQAGKDVFVEKPLALDVKEAKGLLDLAKKKKRILMVGHILQYHPAIRKLKDLVDAGELGDIQYVYSNRLNLGKIRHEENILWSFAPHDVAIILRLVGAMPIQVSACGGNYITANIADVSVSNLLFDDGTRAHVFVSWLHPFKEQRLVVVGDRRMATYDDIAKKLVVYEKRVDRSGDGPVPFQGEGHEIAFSAEEPLRLECQAFLDAIATRRPPLTDGVSGLATLKVLQAAQRSLMTGGEPVPLHRL